MNDSRNKLDKAEIEAIIAKIDAKMAANLRKAQEESCRKSTQAASVARGAEVENVGRGS